MPPLCRCALAAEAADDPEEQAEDDAEQDRGGEGKGDRPSASAPGEVAGESAERQVETAKAKYRHADGDEKYPEDDERAA
jgi:hypothetical protein